MPTSAKRRKSKAFDGTAAQTALKERAKKAGRDKLLFKVGFSLPIEMAEVLIALAEEQKARPNEIARECFAFGLLRYNDFIRPEHGNTFVPRSPFRAYPSDSLPLPAAVPVPHANPFPGMAAAHSFDAATDTETERLQRQTAALAHPLAAPLPQSGTAPPLQSDEPVLPAHLTPPEPATAE